MDGEKLTKEPADGEAPEVFTRKWLLVMLSCGIPVFFLFVALGSPSRGRAAAIGSMMFMSAVKACWSLRTHVWFWIVAGAMAVLHGLVIVFVSWSERSYPGYTLLPAAVMDYAVIYGTFKLVEKASEELKGRGVADIERPRDATR